MNAQDLIATIVTGLLGLLVVFVSALVKEGFRYLSGKVSDIKSETLQRSFLVALDILEDTAYKTVVSLNQTLGDEIRKSLLSKDGVHTRQELLDLKSRAVHEIRIQVGSTILQNLEEYYGDIESLIDNLVEFYVNETKKNDKVRDSRKPLFG